MASAKGPVKKGQPSIKHSCNFAEATKRKLSKVSDREHVEYAYAWQRHNRRRGETKLSQILSRDALISVVDLMWDRSDLVSGNLISSLNEANLDDLKRDEVCKINVSVDSTQLPADHKGKSQLLSTPQSSVQLVRVAEKMCTFKSIVGSCKENAFPLEARWETEQLYSWMKEVVPTVSRYHKGAEIEKRESFEVSASGNANRSGRIFVTTGSESITDTSGGTSLSRSTDVNYLFLLYRDRCANNKGVKVISTDCDTEMSSSSSGDDLGEDSLSMVENKQLCERDKKDQESEVCSSSKETPSYAFAKQRHAFAGALAGISVSLCLHPLDTVKTMIQSCRLEEKSLCYTGRSIISERGFSGLYRGIASNIASSAPISALYTFTYESVKGALLPLFPKEYCSLTHCLAGGSASVATSFIFTPSERIKQQMQVSSHYRNCWTALVGIIQKGGLLSLYAGWSAVLCRNIPHSIIKFYVYENMKQMVLPSLGPGQTAQPTTLQTLVCGGLAGSSAAFFTTPFDVVKTRLQTQRFDPKTGDVHVPRSYILCFI
ncbi:unnamed protein product [Thlaspi arvense]|uniref:Uncharacterized protein n=1 Tax=Thlaspi arvense TaxID=13288 RepID=A0AAU9SR89_THLAR|nr:unnamed protein product [Thlaspi arvense]